MPQRTVQELVSRSQLLCSIIDMEPEVLSVLQRASVRYPYRSRWAAYTAFKEQCRELVGWQARKEELRAAGYYDAVIAALDALLPTSEEWNVCAAFSLSDELHDEEEE